MNDSVNLSQLQQQILALISEKLNTSAANISTETNLIEAGLNSITLMTLVSHWQAKGYAVSFATLAKDPRASVWAKHLLDTYSENAESNPHATLGLTKANIGERPNAPFPLAPMQYAYWLGRDPNQPLGGVSAHLYTEFQLSPSDNHSSLLDPERLGQAMTELIQRHGSLRLRVHSDGQQTQGYNDDIKAQIKLNDLRSKSPTETEELLEKYRQTYSSQILDIESGEVFAIALSLLADGSCRLHLDVDMIAADAISYRTLLRELALLYENPNTPLPVLPLSYKDCRLAIERKWKSIQNSSGQWWKKRLETLPDGPLLPLKPNNHSIPVTGRRHLHFNTELKHALYEQCRKNGITPSVAIATVLAETLAGWSKEPRFLLNVPLFQRPLDGPDISGVIGDFSSSILVDIDTGTKQTFTERAHQVQRRMHEDAAHADYGGVHVLRDLGRMRGRQVTAPVVFTSALNLGELFDTQVRNIFGDPVWIISQGPQVLLDAQVTELDGGILINWDCREDVFVDGVLNAMFEFFHSTILNLATQSESWSSVTASLLPAQRTIATSQSNKATSDIIKKAISPSTPIERTVSAVWCEVIGGSGLDIHQNLFSAGGDSVLATSLIAQLREIFGEDAIDMRTLFASPSIAGIADSISNSNEGQTKQQIAEVYCEILDMGDEALSAELELENG